MSVVSVIWRWGKPLHSLFNSRPPGNREEVVQVDSITRRVLSSSQVSQQTCGASVIERAIARVSDALVR